MLIERIWTKAEENIPNRHIWDFGDTQWELFNSELRYFRIVKRESKSINENNNMKHVIIEHIELLQELPVSIDLLSNYSVKGWIISEKPLYSSESSQDSKKEKSQQPLKQSSQMAKKSHHAKPKQSDEESLVTTSSQSSDIPPIDPSIWSSLSQWIPQYALFQPSLHHLADLELSEQPIQSSPSQKDRSYYSRPSPTQYQQAKHAQQSTYVRQQHPSYRRNHSQHQRVPSYSK